MSKFQRVSPKAPRLKIAIYFDADQIGEVPVEAVPVDAVPDAAASSEAERLLDLACRIYEARRLRRHYLANSLLGEPAWDMLLALYCFTGRGQGISVSGLCQCADVPQTTALRWLQHIESRKLAERTPDERDARRSFLTMSEKGRCMMEDYLRRLEKDDLDDF